MKQRLLTALSVAVCAVLALVAERGIIDIETLVETNQSLIDTINEVMTIQQEGHTRRIEAEKQLYQMESELKKKLLQTNLK